MEDDRWGPLVDADWHAFCQAIYKGIERDECEELYCHHREMSRAAGAKKPGESQKSKSLSAMKAAKDRREEYRNPPAIADRDKIGAVGRTPQRPNRSLEQSFEVLGESLLGLTFGSKRLVKSRGNCNCLQLCGHRNFAKNVGKAVLGRRLVFLGPVGQCPLANSVHLLERSRRVCAARRALFLPCQEGAGGFERRTMQSLCLF